MTETRPDEHLGGPESLDHPGPVVLIVLDGWGLRPESVGNAVALARTPTYDRIRAEYLQSQLQASGPHVGLPEGQMGNSEVGHMTLGAGLIHDQDLLRIGKAVQSGALAANPTLAALIHGVKARGRALHLLGLIGDGGVHAHSDHLKALVTAAAAGGLENIQIHAFTDGRDSAPDAARAALVDLQAHVEQLGRGRISSLIGRYWAMDRDRRWERTERAWRAMRTGAPAFHSALDAIDAAYAAGETDEFLGPRIIVPAGDPTAGANGRIQAGDGVILFNFRADRMRQLLSLLTDPDFDAIPDLDRPAGLDVVTMTSYQKGQSAPMLFGAQDIVQPLAKVIAEAGRTQFHTAETEKYAHVTYFFNGGTEAPFPGEVQHLVPSPKVATYDLQPEMSAVALTDDLLARLATGRDDFVLINFANPDMVGHTGNLEAAIRGVETVDACLGRLLDAVARRGGSALVTADHGNCEMMIDPITGGPHTAHTLNPVPFLIIDPRFRRDAAPPRRLKDGGLRDVAPTVLALMGLTAPPAMTGRVLYD